MELSTNRRRVLQLLSLTGASAGFNLSEALAQDDIPLADLPIAQPRGTVADPNLLDPKYHLEWEKALSPAEMETVSTLCDVIIPADDKSGSASQADVPGFIQEWLSAPYEENRNDRELIKSGLVWLDAESSRRFAKPFNRASEAQKTELCDAICDSSQSAAELRDGARFFDRVRYLIMGGFYTTPMGRADLGFIGNIAMGIYPGASPEALKHLGLA